MSDDKQLPRPHTTVAIRRCVPHATVDGSIALAFETEGMGTIFVPMSPDAIRVVRDALNQLDLLLAQGTGNA